MTFLKRLFKKIGEWYNTLTNNVKVLVPIAINVVEGIKKVMDSPVDDIILSIIKTAIPGTADDVIIDQAKKILEEWIPKILLILYALDEINEISSKEEQLKYVLSHFKLANDDVKVSFYHNFATLILEKLADGKLTRSECIILTEYYYNNEKIK